MTSSVLMLDCELEERIIRLVAAKAGLNPIDISLSSRLLHDLKIDGDDAAELLSNYSEVFQVDISGFNFMVHF